ncbi:hypothetical protein F4604DRAFT_1676646 [Suillus subluteus]|nr:hypothetical protein F4604DRAFT_1676646 [Suillus subluteus]
MSATEKFSGGNKSMVLKLTILSFINCKAAASSARRPQLELLKTDCKQKAFLEKYYSPFLEAQLQATVTHFWIPLYAEWFIKWPEVTLSEEQNIALGKAVDARHKKIHTWFNNRSQKSGKAAVNLMMKSITKLMNNRAKGTRVHSEVEVFSKMMYRESVQEGVKKEIETVPLSQKKKSSSALGNSPGRHMKLLAMRALEECTGPDPHLGDITLVSMAKAKTAEHVRKTCALNYVPQSPPSTTVIPPTMDFSATVKLTDWYTNFIMDSRSLGPADSDTSSANAISAPSMCLPAQTHAATTTISKQAAAPAVTMDKHLPSLVDASRKTGESDKLPHTLHRQTTLEIMESPK